VAQPQLQAFGGHEQQQDKRVQGPETAEAADHELDQRGRALDLVEIHECDDESAQHEEEVDEEPALAHESRFRDVARGIDMQQHDHERAEPAQRIERNEAHRMPLPRSAGRIEVRRPPPAQSHSWVQPPKSHANFNKL
jgi:hypothetical protein